MTRPGARYLFWPAWRSACNRFRARSRADVSRAVQMGAFGAFLWALLTFGAVRMFSTFERHPEIADAVTLKMLSAALAAGFALAVVATTIAAIGVLFLDDDVPLTLAAPVDWLQHYWARLLRSAMHGGWALALVFTPVLVAVGWVRGGGLVYAGVAVVGGGLVLLTAAALGVGAAVLIAWIGGARQARGWLLAVAAAALGVGLFYLRGAAPQQLFRPGGLESSMAVLEMLNAPTFAWLPTEWWARALVEARRGLDVLALGAMAGAAMIATTGSAATFGALYRASFTRRGGGGETTASRSRWRPVRRWLEARFGPAVAQLTLKDVRRLLRDPASWSHLLLVAFSLLIYLYNLQMLPTGGGDPIARSMSQILFLLSIAVGALVLAALCAHLVLPALSLEGPGLHVLTGGPVDARTIVGVKLRVGVLLLVPVGIGLSWVATGLLGAPTSLVLLSVATAASLSIAIVALAVWFGARYALFDASSSSEVASSSAATLFTFSALALALVVLMLEAPLVLPVLRAALDGWGASSTLEAGVSVGRGRLVGAALGLFLPLAVAIKAAREAPTAFANRLAQHFGAE